MPDNKKQHVPDPKYRPIVLVVLDGWGEWDTKMGNPVAVAQLPTIDMMDKYYPKMLVEASGLAVGLPWGVFGNSEVGHQTMGSGQIIYHYLPTITAAIQSGSFFMNENLLKAMVHARENNSDLHIMGLLSDGGVHSHIEHILPLLQMAKQQNLKNVFIHGFTDGRDTPPHSARKYVEQVQAYTKKEGLGELATLSGRYYAMDRNRNFDRVEHAFKALVKGEGIMGKDAVEAVEKQKEHTKTDEYLEPIVLTRDNGEPIALIKENDSVINFNFRGDRARQLSAFFLPEFKEFKEVKCPPNVRYTTFTSYQDDMPLNVVFPPQKITTRLADILSKLGKKQLRIAETEKFAHVTYFFNGGLGEPFAGEDRIFVPSKNVPSYASVPEMSALEVTEKLIKAINTDKYDFCLVNYANPDMVGHTGNFQAGIQAVEVVDGCLDQLIKCVLAKNGCLLITADHGNVEEMVNLESGEIDTQHSTNPVPFWFISPDNKRSKPIPYVMPADIKGMIADIAPTILELMNLPKTKGMIGESLFDRLE